MERKKTYISQKVFALVSMGLVVAVETMGVAGAQLEGMGGPFPKCPFLSLACLNGTREEKK